MPAIAGHFPHLPSTPKPLGIEIQYRQPTSWADYESRGMRKAGVVRIGIRKSNEKQEP